MPHSRSLLRVARRLMSDAVAAEDLVQESLLLAWRGFHQFQAGTNARAWLFKILFNAFHGRGRRPEASTVTVPLPDALRDQAWNASIALDRAAMNAALAELGVEHRAVLLLAVVEGFTCQEIAGILSIPIGTVMSRLSRARQALRSRLQPGAECAEREMK